MKSCPQMCPEMLMLMLMRDVTVTGFHLEHGRLCLLRQEAASIRLDHVPDHRLLI